MGDFLLFCDVALRDEVTRKYSLIGLFNRITTTHFPVVLKPFFLFCQLTGVTGFDHVISISDGTNELFNGELRGPAQPAGLTQDIQFVMTIPPLQSRTEGPLTVAMRQGEKVPEGRHVLAQAELVVDFPPPPHFRDLSREEIGRIIADPAAIKSATAELACRTCGAKACYGISIDPYNALPETVRHISAALVHDCPACHSREWLGAMKSELLNRLGKRVAPTDADAPPSA